MKYLPIYLLLFSIAPSANYAEERDYKNISRALKQVVSNYSEKHPFVGSVTLVAKGNEIIDLQAHGVKNLDSMAPVETDSIFKIHSFTKAVTCAAALMLYEQGKYQFDDPISNWLPAFSELKIQSDDGKDLFTASKPILVKHLFTHTSGISYKYSELFEAPEGLSSFVDSLAEKPLSFEPGTSWEYGMSIDVLGRLIEIWSGSDFVDFIRKQIIEPLEMVDTAFFVPIEKANRQVLIYSVKKEDGSLELDEESQKIPREQPGFCMPGGGLYSTASDYFRFLRMIQNGGTWAGKRYLEVETRDLMISSQLPAGIGWVRFGKQIRDGFSYGYGFNVVTKPGDWDPDARTGECGWGGKASCHYWFDPNAGVMVITLEQIFPYDRSLEKALKGLIYQSLLP